MMGANAVLSVPFREDCDFDLALMNTKGVTVMRRDARMLRAVGCGDEWWW